MIASSFAVSPGGNPYMDGAGAPSNYGTGESPRLTTYVFRGAAPLPALIFYANACGNVHGQVNSPDDSRTEDTALDSGVSRLEQN
jgi:hypothetical protein